MLVVVGETYSRDERVWPATMIFRQAPIPAANKNFVTVLGDRHGKPALVSNHLTALARRGGGLWAGVDALDYYGHWKLLDALCDAAFYGRNRDCALGDTPKQRFMGVWSDGTPVRELRVTDHLK